ncbi:hypothetical protein Daesc_003546 [Daldinia eschscholtzii]|uniref:Ankyrin n=1 Tax=Daldinia eschscholtzii TaxID=292717 RepID=A0AAX6MTA8_9PEZI
MPPKGSLRDPTQSPMDIVPTPKAQNNVKRKNKRRSGQKKRGPGSTPRLSGDIIVYIATEYLHNPRTIARLSKTCRFYRGVLGTLPYRADVLRVKQLYFEKGDFEDYDRSEQGGVCQAWSLGSCETGLDRTALHWAITQDDDRVRTTVARNSIKAALRYWPSYFEVACSDDSCGHLMTPLQQAVLYDVEDMVRELVETCRPVDVRTWMHTARYPCHRSRLNEFTGENSFQVLPLSIAILNMNTRIAEILARLTCDLEDSEGHWMVLSPFRLAAMCGMPSVIEILQSRGYKVGRHRTYLGDRNLTPLHFAASIDNNEETLQLLLNTGYSLDDIDDKGRSAFGIALRWNCVANALFLIKDLSVEEKLNIANANFTALLRTDLFLPVTKALLQGNSITRRQSRRYKNIMRKKIRTPWLLEKIPETLDFLINHPSFNFSRNTQVYLAEKITKAIENKKSEPVVIENVKSPLKPENHICMYLTGDGEW